MKKSILVLVFLAALTAGVFAEGFAMAAGGGLLLDFSANNGVEGTYYGQTGYYGYRNLSFGAYGFFDATYAEVDVSIAYGSITGVEEMPFSPKTTTDVGGIVQLGFSLMGKYPFHLGEKVTLFPLAGISYNVGLSLTGDLAVGDVLKASKFNQFGFLFGGGVDYFFTDSIFLRGELLFQFRLANDYQDMAATGFKYDYPGISIDTTVGMGPRIKIGVGYKF